jgi:hypothetical protein
MELRAGHFHSGGPTAYAGARNVELRKAIQAKYADAMSNASWIERQMIRFEMWCELLQAKREGNKTAHNPSRYTLW